MHQGHIQADEELIGLLPPQWRLLHGLRAAGNSAGAIAEQTGISAVRVGDILRTVDEKLARAMAGRAGPSKVPSPPVLVPATVPVEIVPKRPGGNGASWFVGQRRVVLGEVAAAILGLLVEHAPVALSAERIVEIVADRGWPWRFKATTVPAYICFIRKALRAASGGGMVQTQGGGFLFSGTTEDAGEGRRPILFPAVGAAGAEKKEPARRKARRVKDAFSSENDSCVTPDAAGGVLGAFARETLGCRRGAVVSALFGWDGEPPKDSKEVGLRFNITMERVCQIRRAALPILAAELPRIPWVAAAVRLLRSSGPMDLQVATARLANLGANFPSFDPRGLIAIAHLAEPGCKLEVGEIEGVELIGSAAALRAVREVLARVRRDVRHNGLIDVDALLRSMGAVNLDRDWLRDFLAVHHDVRESPCGRWLALADISDTRLHSRLRKMLSVCSCLRVEDFRDRARAEPRLAGLKLPLDAAEFFLESCGGGIIEDGWFCARSEALTKPEDVLSEVERVMVGALRAAGGAMPHSDFESACVSAGMNRTTFRLYLSWSPVIKRLAKGVFVLVGTDPTPDARRRLVQSVLETPSLALFEHGPAEGQQWFALYRITAASVSNGVLSLPAALRRHVSGRFEVLSPDGAMLGACTAARIYVSGLRRPFRGLGVRTNDIVRLIFDPGSAKVRMHLESR